MPFDREASPEYQMHRTYASHFGESAALRAVKDTIVKLRRCLLKLSEDVLGGQFKKLLEGAKFFMGGVKKMRKIEACKTCKYRTGSHCSKCNDYVKLDDWCRNHAPKKREDSE